MMDMPVENIRDAIDNMLDEHDLTTALHDSLCSDIQALIRSVIASSGNYLADHDTEPMEVYFANGRVVRLSSSRTHLVVSSGAP